MKILALLVFVSSFASAEALKVIRKVENQFDLGIGSEVQLGNLKGTFVGLMKDHPDFGQEFLVMDEKGKVQMVNSSEVSTSIPKKNMQPLISTIDQAGETCAAYAIFHFWHQISEFSEHSLLNLTFAMDRSRMKFLEESITGYYMNKKSDIAPVVRKFGKRFEFSCKQKQFEDSEEAAAFVAEETSAGRPVIMEYFLGRKMVRSKNSLVDFETHTKLDNRLWIPRKRGDRNSGGHAIVAAGSFLHKSKLKFVVLDSNWNEPRIWDAETYLDERTAIKEMIFHTCRPTGL